MIRKREVAKRVFSFEFGKATHQIQGDGVVKYLLTPLGERLNRVFIVGVLLEKEEIGADTNFWRLRVSDPTGSFYTTVGKFQPEVLEIIGDLNVPELVAIVGKPRLFEGVSRKLISLRPENIAVVDLAVRDYWVLETARRTLERIEAMEKRENEDVKLAWRIYNPNLMEYVEVVKKALMSVKEDVEVMEKIEEPERAEEEEEFDFTGFEFEEEEFDLSDLLEE